MSPRTKAQQTEYNTKRRNLSAAKKAPLHGVKGQSVLVVKSDKLTPPKAMVAKPNKELANAKARQAKARKSPAKQKLLAEIVGKAKPAQKVSIKDAEKAAKAFREGYPKVAAVFAKPAGEVDVAKFAKFKRKPVSALADVEAAKATKKLVYGVANVVNGPAPTMALSYVRNGAAGLGMKRGNNYQSTVTFTPAQFMELREKAEFNRRSLAEQIRWSVMQTLRGAR